MLLAVTPSSYAKFAAALITETLVENRRHELEAVLARYLEFHGMTSEVPATRRLALGCSRNGCVRGRENKAHVRLG